MSEATTNRASEKFMLRLPDGMRDQIAEEAKANNRSMNAEIVARLQHSLDEKKLIAEARAQDEAARLRAQYEIARADAEMMSDRMSEVVERLARIEAAMIEKGVTPKPRRA